MPGPSRMGIFVVSDLATQLRDGGDDDFVPELRYGRDT